MLSLWGKAECTVLSNPFANDTCICTIFIRSMHGFTFYCTLLTLKHVCGKKMKSQFFKKKETNNYTDFPVSLFVITQNLWECLLGLQLFVLNYVFLVLVVAVYLNTQPPHRHIFWLWALDTLLNHSILQLLACQIWLIDSEVTCGCEV